jgi:hypothetical protein
MGSEPVEHHGRDSLLGGAGFIAECCATRWGGFPLALFGGALLFLAFWDYTKKYLSQKSPYLRHSLRIAAALCLVVLVVIVSGVRVWSKGQSTKGPEVAEEKKSTSPSQVTVPPSSEVPKPAITDKGRKPATPKPIIPPQEQQPPTPSPPPPITQNCPQGICNGGDNNGDQRVYNFGPPEPKVSWNQSTEPLKDGKYELLVTVSVDRSLDVPAFIASCDGPCSTRFFYTPGVFVRGTILGSRNPRSAVMTWRIPRPLGAGIQVYWYIDSQDEHPIRILSVDKLPVSQLPQDAQ